jgi:SAM-dependent methyltransferase
LPRKPVATASDGFDGADALVASAPRLLKALRLMNADGSVSADKRRKLKQAAHLVRLLRPPLDEALRRTPRPLVWDLNCGSSYASLLLADAVRRDFGKEIELVCVDRDPARVDACRLRALEAGFPEATFVFGDTETAPLSGRPDFVLSLHGCDVASDHALRRAAAAEARHVAVAPCCHRELRSLLKREPPHEAFLRDGAAADDYAALLSDVGRAEFLRAEGYRADLTAFVPSEHTPKNRLVRGERVGKKDARAARFLATLAASCAAPPSFARPLKPPSADAF